MPEKFETTYGYLIKCSCGRELYCLSDWSAWYDDWSPDRAEKRLIIEWNKSNGR